ncbi:MAG TPA: hypothetical protein VL727_04505 [Puia sp.]|nr:hypothetical protein [Puia sp.]
MSTRDKRYDNIASLYKDGKVTTLTDIFKTVPKTVISIDIGKRVVDFNKRLNKPDLFEIGEIYLIGRLCGLTESEIYDLYEDHYFKIKNGKITGDGKKVTVKKKSI